MSPWIFLLVPVVGAIVMLVLFSRKVLWWELLIPTAATALVIFLAKIFVTMGLLNSTEYRGSIIVSARYTEFYETYVEATCSRTVSCGKNCTTTVYYDCSYCDDHQPHWDAYDAYGHKYQITQEKYERLKRQWSANPEFVNLNRKINYHGSCGKDGNAYDIHWDKDPNTADACVFTNSYVNRPQASKSAFSYEEIKKEEAKKLGLYEYPEFFDFYRQPSILGIDSIVGYSEANRIKHKFEYFDGYYGHNKHIKLFVLLFFDKPLSIAHKQEAYWKGGNGNELVVCIGMNRSTRELTWTKAFSWSVDKRPIVDCREDIMNDTYFNADSTYSAIERTVVTNFKPRNMDEDFSYLSVDIPTWAYVLIFILSLAATVGTSYWVVTNEYEYEENSNNESSKIYQRTNKGRYY